MKKYYLRINKPITINDGDYGKKTIFKRMRLLDVIDNIATGNLIASFNYIQEREESIDNEILVKEEIYKTINCSLIEYEKAVYMFDRIRAYVPSNLNSRDAIYWVYYTAAKQMMLKAVLEHSDNSHITIENIELREE